MLALTSCLVVALLIVPYQALDALRAAVPPVGAASEWLGGIAPGLDIEHLVAFAALGMLARFARPLGPRLRGDDARRSVRDILLLIAVGIVTELAQLLIPSRSTNLDDLLLNVAGALSGYCLAGLLAAAFRPRA